MALTAAQWDKLQSNFPSADRISYAEYLNDIGEVAPTPPPAVTAKPAVTGSVLSRLKADAQEPRTDSSVSAEERAVAARATARATARALEAKNQAEIDYGTKILAGGLTQAQIDSIAGAQTTAGLIGGRVDPATGYVTSQYETPEQKANRAAEVARIEAEAKAKTDAAAKKLAKDKEKAEADKIAAEKAVAAATSAAAAEKAKADLAALLKQRDELAAKEKRINELSAKLARGEQLTNEERAFLGLGPITASNATKKITSTTYTGKGKDRKKVVTYDDGTTETTADPEIVVPKKITSTTFTGTGKDRKKVVTYDDGTTETTADPEAPGGKAIRFTAYQGTGKNRKRVITYTDNTVDTIDDPDLSGGSKTIKSTTYTGTGANRKKIITYDDDTTETIADPEGTGGTGTGGTGTGGTGTGGTGTGGFTQKDIDAAVKAAQDAATKAATDAATAASKTTARKNMIEVLYSRFKNYGLETLAAKIEKLAIDGATEDTITLQLQESEEYKTRFKANDVRVKNNLKYLSPAEYLNLEDSYRQVLRAYGLKTFDTDDYVSKFIANDMSPTELSNRVVTAVQRVQNADPALIKQLNEFYGLKSEGLVAYVLDPEQQFQKIERQIAAGEIGVAAARQGFATGKDFAATAEQLAAQGISQAEAQKGYATIADILPGAEKLSSIYGKTMDTYGQAEGEQEVFNSLASAQRKRQKLSATEAATFGGSTGMNRVSLTSTKPAGQI